MKKYFTQYRGLRRENYILFYGRLMTSLGSMVWPMLTMILNQKLGMDAGTIATCLLVFGALSIPAGFFGGRMADRCNKKNIIVGADCVSIACFLACAFRKLDFFSVVIFAVGGLFQTIENPAYSALIADLTPSKDRERAFSLNYLGGNLGLMLAPTIGSLLFKDYLWLAFLINGLSLATSTVLIFFGLKDIHPAEETGPRAEYEKKAGASSTLSVLRSSLALMLFFLSSAMYGIVYSQFNYLMPLDLTRVFPESGPVLFGTMTSLNCIVVVIFTPMFTRWFERIEDIGKVVWGMALVLAGMMVFALGMEAPALDYLSILVFTWGEIFETLGKDPYITRRVPMSHRGRVLSLSAIVQTVFFAAGEKLVGGIYDSLGSHAAWQVVLGIGLAGIALALLAAKRDRKEYPRLHSL